MEGNDGETTPVSPEALSSLVSTRYDLTGRVACEWLSSGLNDVCEVTAGGDTYILKAYRSGWRTEAEALQQMMERINDGELP